MATPGQSKLYSHESVPCRSLGHPREILGMTAVTSENILQFVLGIQQHALQRSAAKALNSGQFSLHNGIRFESDQQVSAKQVMTSIFTLQSPWQT